jgi:hypothetical protein
MIGIQDIKDRLNKPPSSPVPTKLGGSNADTIGLRGDMDEIYKPEQSNWYSAKPYGFKFYPRGSEIPFTMFLPINPSNLTISTPFATNIVTTLYGTIEEHSDVRYFDISIEGTTGISPQFVEPGHGEDGGTLYQSLRLSGRSTVSVASSISAGGFFSKTLAAVNAVIGKASDLVNGAPKPKTGVFSEQSGYVAFHNLYRFLLNYKKDAAGVTDETDRTRHPLTFFNYKDNNQYDVIVRSFSLRRSAENPMLYNYSIQLRGYNLSTIQAPISDSLQNRLAQLGLNGVDSSSLLGDIKSISSQAKGIVGSLVGGLSVLGR